MAVQPELDPIVSFEEALSHWLETVKEIRSFSGFRTKKAHRSALIPPQEWIRYLLEARGREVAAHEQLLAAIDQLSRTVSG